MAASGITWAAMNCRPSLPVFVLSFARLRVLVFAGKLVCFASAGTCGYIFDLESKRGTFAHGDDHPCFSVCSVLIVYSFSRLRTTVFADYSPQGNQTCLHVYACLPI